MAIDFNNVPSYIKKEINPPSKTLKRGSKGRAVKQVQEWLQYHRCPTAIDGKFGPATANCVKDFQTAFNLSATGKVDKATWQALVNPMSLSLAPPSIGPKEAAASTVANVAKQHVAHNPIEIGGANCGPWVRLYCEGNDGPHWAWCAGFASFIMQQAYFYRNEPTPIKGSVSCDSLAAQAKAKKLFISKRKLSAGSVDWQDFKGACIFLRRRTASDWTHAGIATVSEGKGNSLVFSTIEGNTNDEGHREGFEACERKRSLSGTHYDFIAFDSI